MPTLYEQYKNIRQRSVAICRNLQTEDYVVQPVADVSPPKWHLGHTSWFFEQFILKPNAGGYTEFDSRYAFVFNSYYETLGARVIRTNRGNLSRPSVADVYRYRSHVDSQMELLLCDRDLPADVVSNIVLGLNHEQQHQELLLTDIKYILGHNPLFPKFDSPLLNAHAFRQEQSFAGLMEGVYEIGYDGNGFCFDNELGRHKVYLNHFEIAMRPVTNAEYLEFIDSGGYTDFRHWHADGWDWVRQQQAKAPLYWHQIDGKWMHYTFNGLQEIDGDDFVCHVNYYEASAFAASKNMRLPTEAEWEAASEHFSWGQRWEWTESAYLPYPGYKKADGAIGEYNGKFMVSQMVLRGASIATPPNHSRNTYRNFFQPWHQWQFSGIRLAR